MVSNFSKPRKLILIMLIIINGDLLWCSLKTTTKKTKKEFFIAEKVRFYTNVK